MVKGFVNEKTGFMDVNFNIYNFLLDVPSLTILNSYIMQRNITFITLTSKNVRIQLFLSRMINVWNVFSMHKHPTVHVSLIF